MKPTLKEFTGWMKKFKELNDNVERANEGLKLLYDDFNGVFLGWHEQFMLDLIKRLMDDVNDWIGWYIYENKWGQGKMKCYDKNNKLLKSKTIEDLYNLVK